MTDTSKETVILLALTLDARSPNNTHFDQKRAASTLFSLCAERDETKVEIERLRKCLLDCDGIFSRFGYTKNSVARENIAKALKGTSDD